MRRSDPAEPGYRRRRRGRGFSYLDPDGCVILDPATLQHFKELVIPPAWEDVWICMRPNGHIQAIGTDAAGRRQYLYHPEWRNRRDAAKHARVLELAGVLPRARRRVTKNLGGRGTTRERVLAGAFRLLDLGFFRIGSESYAEANGTFGLATIRRDHVQIRADTIYFDYPAKGAIEREQRVVDPDLAKLVRTPLRRTGDDSPELLAYRSASRGWCDVRSEDVNDYVRAVTGGEFTAKDFRTWHATVLMAQALAVSGSAPKTETGRKRAVTRAVGEVAGHLGNTPAVARRSYIDSRVIDLYLDDVTIDPALVDTGIDSPGLAIHGPVERATLRLLTRPARRRTATRT